MTCVNGLNIYSNLIISERNSLETAQLFMTLMSLGDIFGPIFTFFYLEKVGRKFLSIFGLCTVILIFLIFSISGYAKYYAIQKYCFLMFKIVFASSVAPVYYIYNPEILPVEALGIWGALF